MWYHLQSVLCLNSGTRLILTSRVNVFNRCFSLKTGQSHWGDRSCLQEKVESMDFGSPGWKSAASVTDCHLAPPETLAVTQSAADLDHQGARAVREVQQPPTVLPLFYPFLCHQSECPFFSVLCPQTSLARWTHAYFCSKIETELETSRKVAKKIHRPAYFQLASNKSVNTDRNHIIEFSLCSCSRC